MEDLNLNNDRIDYLKSLAVEAEEAGMNHKHFRFFVNPTKELTKEDVVEDLISLFEAVKNNSSDIKPYYSSFANKE